MRGLRLPLCFLVLSYLVLGLVLAWGYRYLPHSIATHFDIHGRPNGWMTREGCVWFVGALGLLAPGSILGGVWLASEHGVSHFNWGGRQVRLPRDRAGEARVLLRQAGLWFAGLLVLFLAGAQVAVLLSNLGDGPPHLDGVIFGLIVALFVIGNGLISVRLVRFFLRMANEKIAGVPEPSSA